MTTESKRSWRDAGLQVLVAFVISAAVCGVGFYSTQQVYGYRLDRAEQDITHVNVMADKDRDTINQIALDVAWIKGKLQGQQEK